MKRLKKITLNELRSQVKVLDKNEEKQYLGGTDDYHGTPVTNGSVGIDGNTWYTPDQASLLKSFGLWDGGYVLGQGYYPDASGITASAGVGSPYEDWLTQMMSASMPTTSGITIGSINTNLQGATDSAKAVTYNQVLTMWNYHING